MIGSQTINSTDGVVMIRSTSGETYQVTKSVFEAWLNGDITFTDLTVTGNVVIGGTTQFSGVATFLSPNSYFTVTGITAGTTQTQAGATAMTAEWNNITVCAHVNDGVKLPTAVAGLCITVKNNGANVAKIYPVLGGAIDDLGANVAILCPVGAWITFRAIDGTTWESTAEALSATTLTGTTLNITTIAITGGITGNSMQAAFYPTAAQQTVTGAGAINITSYLSLVDTTVGAFAITLAGGAKIGQMKKILMSVDGGDATLTLTGYISIVFNDATDYVILTWNGSAWFAIENSGCVISA